MHARRHPDLSSRLQPERLEDRSNPSTAYLATDLVSDLPGVAPITDPTLLNAWGISLNPAGGAFWVSSNGDNLSELYSGDLPGKPLTQAFKVNVFGGAPTGQVFANITDGFVVSATDATGATKSGQSVFIFASESGMITGWNPGVLPRDSVVGFEADDGAIYKGLALAKVGTASFLYAADFHNGKIDVIDSQFHKVALGTGDFETFTDPNLPAGYAPFNVASIGGKLYVSYAKQDADAEDDVAGAGHGFIDVFETNGHFDGRLVSGGDLNSPWGMVKATDDFGEFSGALLVGNFGDGRIHAYDPTTGAELGTLSQSPGHPLVIDGLWGLAFGNGTSAGDANTLYYAAGPDGEAHGLFGKITANAAGTNPVSATLTGTDLVITGSRNDDVVQVSLTHHRQILEVQAGGQTIGTFDASAVQTIHFSGFAGNDVFAVNPKVTAAVFADGGADDDELKAGAGGGVLLGNAGDDVLLGGAGRDILIGGTGHDFLSGFRGEDILIGGSTTHDEKPAELAQLFDAWNSGGDFATRVAAIRVAPDFKLDTTTVIDDGVRDELLAGFDMDWFFTAGPDVIHGKTRGDQVN